MMRARHIEEIGPTTFRIGKRGGRVCGVLQLCPTTALIVLVLIFVLASSQHASAQNLFLQSVPGGITLTSGGGGGTRWSGSFGVMNGLGIGPASAGVTIIPLSNGALYYSLYQLRVTGLGTNNIILTAHVNTNFTHPAALVMESCMSTSACTSASQYSAMSLNAGAETTVVPPGGIANNQTVTAGLGIFVPDNNGAAAFTGNDSVRITLNVRATSDNDVLATAELRLDTPNETVQSAVRLNLATAPGGLTVTPVADFAMNFGNVNGLGIGPGAGLTTVAATGGIIYSTPYLLQPAFSDFASTTGTIKVFVNSDFAHPASLQLDDASASGGPYNAISKVAGTPTVITTAAANRSSITRYLGLFVSNLSGPTSFAGSDNAQLTFTLTVP